MLKLSMIALAVVPSIIALPILPHVPSVESQTGADALRDVLKLVASPTMKAYPAALLDTEPALSTERYDAPWDLSPPRWQQVSLQSSEMKYKSTQEFELK